MILRAITFNMCHGQGLDDIIDVKRQAEFLKKLKPDIIFLQEIDMYTQRVDNKDQIYSLSKHVGLLYRSMGINIKYKNGFYGDGMLCRFPIEYSTNYLMPLIDDTHEQRGLLHNKISFGTTRLNLFSVHLSTNEKERILAVKELIRVIKKLPAEEIVIVGGDFNVGVAKIGPHKYSCERKESYPEYQLLSKVLNKVNNIEDTWFSAEGVGCIDTMFYSKNIKVAKFETIKTDLTDHSAVMVDFDI